MDPSYDVVKAGKCHSWSKMLDGNQRISSIVRRTPRNDSDEKINSIKRTKSTFAFCQGQFIIDSICLQFTHGTHRTSRFKRKYSFEVLSSRRYGVSLMSAPTRNLILRRWFCIYKVYYAQKTYLQSQTSQGKSINAQIIKWDTEHFLESAEMPTRAFTCVRVWHLLDLAQRRSTRQSRMSCSYIRCLTERSKTVQSKGGNRIHSERTTRSTHRTAIFRHVGSTDVRRPLHSQIWWILTVSWLV